MSRTSKSIRNILTGLISQVLMIAVGFFARKTFLIVLDAEYLGVSGLFSSRPIELHIHRIHGLSDSPREVVI